MINSTQQAVDLLGHQIECVQDEDGSTYVPLKKLCEILGIDYKSQRMKVKRNAIISERTLLVAAKNGKQRKAFCLPLKKMDYWLYRIDPKTVRPEIAQTLKDYQEDMNMWLTHRLLHGFAINPAEDAERIESRIRESLETSMRDSFPNDMKPTERRLRLLVREIVLFRRFENEPPRFRNKAEECIRVAIDKYGEWFADFLNDAAHHMAS